MEEGAGFAQAQGESLADEPTRPAVTVKRAGAQKES